MPLILDYDRRGEEEDSYAPLPSARQLPPNFTQQFNCRNNVKNLRGQSRIYSQADEIGWMSLSNSIQNIQDYEAISLSWQPCQNIRGKEKGTIGLRRRHQETQMVDFTNA